MRRWLIFALDEREGRAAAARDDLEFPADGGFHVFRETRELFHLFRGGHDGAVAAQVGADARKVHVGQALRADGRLDQFPAVPPALAQVAEVRHQDHAVRPVLPGAFLFDAFDDAQIALQAVVAAAHQPRDFRGHRHADQHGGQAQVPQPLQLAQARGGDLRAAALCHALGDLVLTVCALHHGRHLNAAAAAAFGDRSGVLPQAVQMTDQPGIRFLIHCFSPEAGRMIPVGGFWSIIAKNAPGNNS